MNTRLFGLLAAWVCFLPSLSHGDDPVLDPAVLEQLRTQAVQDWQAIERGLRSVDVTYRFSYRDGPQGNLNTIANMTLRIAYDFDRQLALMRTQKDDQPGGMYHHVANKHYNFDVSTPDMTTKGSLQKVQLVENAGSNPKSDNGLPDWNNYRRDLMAATHVASLRLSDLLIPAEFKPIEAVQFTEESLPRIRYSAKYLGSKEWDRIEGGTYTVILDPAHRHRLLWAEINVPGSRRETFSVSYHPESDVDVPQEFVFRTFISNHRSERRHTYELPQQWALADEEFYLPHYGFSEQVLETLDPNPWPRWLLVAFGIFTIALGAWLIRDKRERAA